MPQELVVRSPSKSEEVWKGLALILPADDLADWLWHMFQWITNLFLKMLVFDLPRHFEKYVGNSFKNMS